MQSVEAREKSASGVGTLWAAVLAVGVFGCLPAYDNQFSVENIDAGMRPEGGVIVDAGSSDLGLAGSGKFVTGIAYNADELKTASTLTISIAGYELPQFSGMTNYMGVPGKFRFEIPQAVVASMAPTYFLIDGIYVGEPILRTRVYPPRLMNGGTQNTNIAVHYFRNPMDANSIPKLVAAALVTGGIIGTATNFTQNYGFVYGVLEEFTITGDKSYKNYSIQLSLSNGDGGNVPLDNTNCKPDQQCCYYYLDPMNQIQFGSATSSNAFVILCPPAQVGSVHLTQTAPLSQIFEPVSGGHPTKPFPDLDIPPAPGEGVHISWSPQ